MVYEVTVGGERVASASVPDAGVNRSFPPREPVAGQEGHFFAPAPTHDILVRVPSDSVSLRALPRVEIALYRVKEGPLPRTEDAEPLGQRFSRELPRCRGSEAYTSRTSRRRRDERRAGPSSTPRT